MLLHILSFAFLAAAPRLSEAGPLPSSDPATVPATNSSTLNGLDPTLLNSTLTDEPIGRDDFDEYIETGIRVTGNSLMSPFQLRYVKALTTRPGSWLAAQWRQDRLTVYVPAQGQDYTNSNHARHPHIWLAPKPVGGNQSSSPLFMWDDVRLTLTEVLRTINAEHKLPWTNLAISQKPPQSLWKSTPQLLWTLVYKQDQDYVYAFMGDTDRKWILRREKSPKDMDDFVLSAADEVGNDNGNNTVVSVS